MDKEETILKNRFLELSALSYQRNIVVFSDFLGLNELNILHCVPKNSFLSRYETFGGYETAERRMAAFFPSPLYYEYQYPIRTLKISSCGNPKFSESLCHRDYLGAVLNLGIDRRKLGDILINEGAAYLFAAEEIASYIKEQLSFVKRTKVSADFSETYKALQGAKKQRLEGTVASVRLDAILSLGFSLSRSRLASLIESGRVFVNGKLTAVKGHTLKKGDVISVRGMGKLSYEGVLSQTRKGRYIVAAYKYI